MWRIIMDGYVAAVYTKRAAANREYERLYKTAQWENELVLVKEFRHASKNKRKG